MNAARTGRHASRRRSLSTLLNGVTWAGVVRIVGLGLIINEALTRGDERPTTLLLFAAMIGLPNFFGGSKKDPEEKP